jgi:uncharacterized Zn finger protein
MSFAREEDKFGCPDCAGDRIVKKYIATWDGDCEIVMTCKDCGKIVNEDDYIREDSRGSMENGELG